MFALAGKTWIGFCLHSETNCMESSHKYFMAVPSLYLESESMGYWRLTSLYWRKLQCTALTFLLGKNMSSTWISGIFRSFDMELILSWKSLNFTKGSPPEEFLGKLVLQICSKFTPEYSWIVREPNFKNSRLVNPGF